MSELDAEGKIILLMKEIKSIVFEYNLNKSIVIQDFIHDLLKDEHKKSGVKDET